MEKEGGQWGGGGEWRKMEENRGQLGEMDKKKGKWGGMGKRRTMEKNRGDRGVLSYFHLPH